MLFLVSYRPRAGRVEGEEKRVLNLFVNWKPPQGSTIKAHYARADGGGLVIFDSNSAISSVEALAPWVAFLDYEIVPIVEMAEALPLLQRAVAWRESVK
jgi:hypothetical protein